MRFLHTDLGNMNFDVGPGTHLRYNYNYRVVGNVTVVVFPEICHTLSRDAGNDCSLVRFTPRMNIDIFKSGYGIPYKYAVYSQRLEETNNPCEYLYGAPCCSQYTNRVLRVPIEKWYPGGKHMYILMPLVLIARNGCY